MKVLVTGGAGFIGSHLVDALVGLDHDVVVLDALVPEVHKGWPAYVNPDARYIEGNVADPMMMNVALRGAEVVFHCAARLGVQRSLATPDEFIHDNVLGTAVLMTKAVKAGVRRVIVSSSMGVYGEGLYECHDVNRYHPSPRTLDQFGAHAWDHSCPRCGDPMVPIPTDEQTRIDPCSIYSLTKYDQEKTARLMGETYSIQVIALRYFNAYGPRQALSNPYSGVGAIFASRLRAGQHPQLCEDGQQTRDFVYVDDIVRANLLAMSADVTDAVINIGTGVGTTIERLAREFAEALGVSIDPTVTSVGRLGDIRHSHADVMTARDLIGYEPTVTVPEGVRRTAAWLREESHV